MNRTIPCFLKCIFRIPRLTSKYEKGKYLTEEQLRELWHFRLQYMRLKETTNPEDDFEAFSDYLRKGVVVQFLHKGQLKGFLVTYYEKKTYRNKAYIAVMPEYGFIAPEFRRYPNIVIVLIKTFLRCLRKHPFTPIYLFAAGYPSAYLGLQSNYPVHLLHDKEIPTFEKEILFDFAQTKGGERFNPETMLMDMPTLPSGPKSNASNLYNHIPILQKSYLAANPEWYKGFTCLFISPFKPVPAFRRFLGRLLPSAKRRPEFLAEDEARMLKN